MSTTTILDPQAIDSLRAISPDDGGEFLNELIDIYLADTPQRIAEIEQCLASQNAGDLTRAAHSIKGSAANLGAAALRTAAEKLEHHARTQGLVAVEAFVAEIGAEFARAETELKKIIAPH